MSEINKANATAASHFEVGPLHPGTLQVTIKPGVTQDSLYKIIDRIGRLHGCLACGLGGLDLLIRQQDLYVIEAFKEIEAVADVRLQR
jgi:hypothetical protein